MCGIVGYFSTSKNLTKNHQKRNVLVELIMANTMRGLDSTGIFGVNMDNEVISYKNVVPGWDFIEMKRPRAILTNLQEYKSIVVHNRHATMGGVHIKTAHPFEFEKIVGVHNGTLDGHWHLCKGTYPVDSQSMFAGFDENGPITTLKKASGPIALMYYDKAAHKLGVYRNNERPLAYAKVKDEPTFFYASELDMLKWILERNKLEYALLSEVPPNTLFEIDINDWKERTETLVKYEPPTPVHRSAGPYDNRDWEYEDQAHWPGPTRQAGFVPLNDVGRNALMLPRQDPAGYKVGDKIFAEISACALGAGGKYECSGGLMGHDFAKIKIQGVSDRDYKKMLPYIKENRNFFLYVSVMGIHSTFNPELKWLLVSPFKEIEKYATNKCQDKLMETFCQSFAEEPKDPKSEATSADTDVSETPALVLPPALMKESDETKNSAGTGGNPHGYRGKKDDNFTGFVKGPNNKPVSLKEFKELVKDGCCVCSDPMDEKDNIDWDSFPQPGHRDCVTRWEFELNNQTRDKLHLPKKVH